MELQGGQRGEKAKVRVVFWAGSFERAGTQRFLLELLRRLDRERFEPIVFAIKPEGELLPAITSLGVPVHAFGAWSGPLAPATLRDVLRAVLFLRREKVQILSCMLGITTILGPFVGRLAGVPVVVNNQRNLTYWFSGGVREWSYGFVNRRLVDAVLVNSGTARQELIDRFGVDSEAVVDIGVGIDATRFTDATPDAGLRAELELEGKRVVGIVAKLSPVKNHSMFLEAAAAMTSQRDDVEFLIVGDGPLRSRLEKKASELGLGGRVHFLGAQEDVPSILKLMDVFVLTSRSEGAPNAIVEAMASGLPVVATRVGGVPEIVVDGTTGLMVGEGQAGDLASAVLGLLADPERAKLMGDAAAERALKRYDVSVVVRGLEDVFDALLCAAGAGGAAAPFCGEAAAFADGPRDGGEA